MSRVLILLLLVCCFTACDTGYESVVDLLAGPPAILPVVVEVVTTSNGNGNDLWTPDFTQQVLTSAEGYLASTVRFPLVSLITVPGDTTYQLSQLALMA